MPDPDPISEFLKNNQSNQQFIDAVRKVLFGVSKGPANLDHLAPLAIAIDCSLYAQQHMGGKPRFPTRAELLTFATAQISSELSDGLILEFGVHSGATINHIANRLPNKTIYGFDSFKGLPEDWTALQKKGTFELEKPPIVRPNVELVVGMFDETLPKFVETHAGSASLIHVDCDLYSSTKTVLDVLNDRIVVGTVIVFDEYFNYREWRLHEFKAFREFCEVHKVKYEYIGLVPSYEQVAVRITQRL
jgi:predicted O-methyltransferase YrrM